MATIPPAPSGQFTWTEPESPFNPDEQPVYPHNKVWETESGHSFEMDDTKDRERIRLQHRSKTFMEMHPDGSEVHKVYGDGYEITLKNKHVLIKGFCTVTIEGDSSVHVKGNKIEKIDGDFIQEVSGNYAVNVMKKTSMISQGDMTMGCGDALSGTTKILNGDSTLIDGDLTVNGTVTAQVVTADEKIHAGLGVTAGPYGFATELGGITVGLPAHTMVPGMINASFLIEAPFILGAFVTGGWVSDIAGSMMGMRFDHNLHNHIAPFGPTTIPTDLMDLV